MKIKCFLGMNFLGMNFFEKLYNEKIEYCSIPKIFKLLFTFLRLGPPEISDGSNLEIFYQNWITKKCNRNKFYITVNYNAWWGNLKLLLILPAKKWLNNRIKVSYFRRRLPIYCPLQNSRILIGMGTVGKKNIWFLTIFERIFEALLLSFTNFPTGEWPLNPFNRACKW